MFVLYNSRLFLIISISKKILFTGRTLRKRIFFFLATMTGLITMQCTFGNAMDTCQKHPTKWITSIPLLERSWDMSTTIQVGCDRDNGDSLGELTNLVITVELLGFFLFLFLWSIVISVMSYMQLKSMKGTVSVRGRVWHYLFCFEVIVLILLLVMELKFVFHETCVKKGACLIWNWNIKL